MANAVTTEQPAVELSRPEFLRRVNALRRVDNVRSWLYLAREYAYLAAVLIPVLALYHGHASWGVSWPWLVPATALAVVLVGVGQHRLAMLGHEASHYLLFRNPVLNETAANWFCFYPVWSMAYNYRLQHLAHHQHTNDPELDPDFTYMELTGQKFYHPMPFGKFLRECVIKLFLWVPGLVRNLIVRGYLANQGGGSGPYRPRTKSAPVLWVVHVAYQGVLFALLVYGASVEDLRFVIWPPAVLVPLLLAFTWLAPDRWYMQTAVRPSVRHKWAVFQRHVFFALLFGSLAWLDCYTDRPWLVYYVLLWILPMATVFSFLMLLREEVQHSNTPPRRFLDSRNFKGHALVRWAVFPLGQGLHLPHHLFPLVPHYNLQKLEQLLRETEVYRANAVDVELLRHGGEG